MFYCTPCSFDGHRLENLRKHLWSTKHELKEGKNHTHQGGLDYVSVTRTLGRNYPAKPEYATSKIAVWWDMNDCPIPEGYDATLVRPSLEGAFKKLGYSSPVSITAYGDQTQTSHDILRGLSSTGVDVSHAFSDVNCKGMRSDLMAWQRVNPPPATMMLISDRVETHFSVALVVLQQLKKYNLFLAYSSRPHQMSVMLTSAEWVWDSLLAVSETRPLLQIQRFNETGAHSKSTVSETRGLFSCKSCDYRRVENLRKHLSGKKHAVEERNIFLRVQNSQNQREEWIEESILSDIRSSKYKREQRLEAENFPKSKRFRTGFRLLDNHLRRGRAR